MIENNSQHAPSAHASAAWGAPFVVALAAAGVLCVGGLVAGFGYLMKWFISLGAPFGMLFGLYDIGKQYPEKRNSLIPLALFIILGYGLLLFLTSNGFFYVSLTIIVLALSKRMLGSCRYDFMRGFYSGIFSSLLFGVILGYASLSILASLICTLLFGASIWSFYYYLLRFRVSEKSLSLSSPEKDAKKGGFSEAVRENAAVVFSAILIAALIRIFVVDNYEIPTGSMIPNLLEGDRLFVTKFEYGARIPVLPNWKLPPFSDPKQGDIIVFQTPTYRSPSPFLELADLFTFGVFRLDPQPKNYVKRLIGMPGDRIRMDAAGVLYINGKKIVRRFYQRRRVQYLGMLDGRVRADVYVNGRKIHSYVYLQQGGQLSPGETRTRDFTLYRENGRIVQYERNKLRQPFPDLKSRAAMEVFAYAYIGYNMLQSKRTVSVVTLAESKKKTQKNLDIVAFNDQGEAWFRLAGKTKLRPLIEKKGGYLWIVVPKNHYFMMGDNRDYSDDSRYWGFVHKGFVMGTPLVRYWPFKRFGSVK